MLDMLLCDYEEESQLATPGAGSNPSPSGASGASGSWHRGLSAVAAAAAAAEQVESQEAAEAVDPPTAPVIAALPAPEVLHAKEADQTSGFQGRLTARELAAVERFGRRLQEPEPSEATGDVALDEAAVRSRGRGRGRGSGGVGGRPLDSGRGTWNQPFETPMAKQNKRSPIPDQPSPVVPHMVPPLVLEPPAPSDADVSTSAVSPSAAPALPKQARGLAGTFFGRYPPDSPRRLLSFQQLKEHFQRHHGQLSGTPRRARKVGSATTAQMSYWKFVHEHMLTAAEQHPETPRTELMGEAVRAWRLNVESLPTPPAKTRSRKKGAMKPQSLADRLDAEDEAASLPQTAGATEKIESRSAKRCRTADGSLAGGESETSGRLGGEGGVGDGLEAGPEAGEAKADAPADSKDKTKAKSKAKAEAKAKKEPKAKAQAKPKSKAKSKAKPEAPALKESEQHLEEVESAPAPPAKKRGGRSKAVLQMERALEPTQPDVDTSGGAENSSEPQPLDIPTPPECTASWDISMSAETCVLGEILGESDSVDPEEALQPLSGLPLQIESELSGLTPPECEVEDFEEEPAYSVSYQEDDGEEDLEAIPPDSARMSE